MTRNRRFVNSFWEPDFNGSVGFDCLCKHIRDGQKTCRDIEDFFKKRAKAEQAYSKALTTLAKSTEGREETGVLGSSWQEVRVQTESMAHNHEAISSEYYKLAEEISRFVDELKQAFKPMEERVKESQRTKKSAYNKTNDSQRTYHSKCRENVQQENQLAVANQSVTISTKESEKIKSKVEKSKEAMEQSDSAYKQALEVLERARKSWETDMEEACELFQKQEEERISFMRNQLWKSTNVDSQLCVDWDESCEKVRLLLEQCEVEKDILEFIDNNTTGSVRPAPILYENYFNTNGKSEDAKQSPRTPRKHPTTHPPLPPIPPLSHSTVQNCDNGGVYSYANPDSLHLTEPAQKYKVTRSFIPTGKNNGIVVRRGDIVKQVGPDTKSGQIKVLVEESDMIGLVPVENLQPI